MKTVTALSAQTPQLSVVLPCLNEKPSLSAVIAQIRRACDDLKVPYEIIVADNGSTDGSREEAARLGARVVPVAKRGYGAAVHGGILAAEGEMVIFGDADGSYPFDEIPHLLKPLQTNQADIVVGNRLNKQTSSAAMPWLHRYIGTPILSFFIRFFYGIDVHDCNGGLRALKREKYEQLGLRCSGMEYASEMLIRAAKHNWKYQEIPIALRPADASHIPHLRTWRDGLRHLKTIMGGIFGAIHWRKNAGLLAFFLLVSGLYGLYLGQDADWDMLNYHLYNPFALLTGRLGHDVMPAGIHTFFNPVLDVPLYLGVRYLNNYPRFLTFLLSFPAGVFAFFIYKINRLFFSARQERMFAWVSVAVGCSGSMLLSQVALSSEEPWAAMLLAAATYGFLRFLQTSREVTAWAFFSALLAGLAMGCKLTAAPWVAGLGVAFLINLKGTAHPWKLLGGLVVGGLAGFLITDGYFLIRLWHLYGNPVFPFFNDIFKSPYFAAEHLYDGRFFPQSGLQWLFYPFYWAFDVQRQVTEIPTRDPRLALGYLGIILLLLGVWRSKKPLPNGRMIFSLAVVWGLAYVLWMYVYSILRYAVMLEAVGVLLLVWVCRQFVPRTKALVLCVALGLVTWCATVIPDWRHQPFSSQYISFTPSLPKLKDRALVVFFGHTMSFMAMFMPKGTQFAGGVHFPVEKYPEEFQKRARQRNSLPEVYYGYRFDPQIKAKIARHNGPIYVVGVPWEMMLNPITLAPYGLQATAQGKAACRFFNANVNLYSRGWNVCKVEKLTDKSL